MTEATLQQQQQGYVQGLERDRHLPPALEAGEAPLILRSHMCPTEYVFHLGITHPKAEPTHPHLHSTPLPSPSPANSPVLYILENQHLSAL